MKFMQRSRAVDRAIVSGVVEAEILELKKTEITDRVKESVEQNGNKPELFGDIVRAAIVLLEKLIAKVMQKVMELAEKVIGKVDDAVKETPKDMDSQIHVNADPAVQSEKKMICGFGLRMGVRKSKNRCKSWGKRKQGLWFFMIPAALM